MALIYKHTFTEVMSQFLINQITRLCYRFTPEYTRNPGNSGVTRAL